MPSRQPARCRRYMSLLINGSGYWLFIASIRSSGVICFQSTSRSRCTREFPGSPCNALANQRYAVGKSRPTQCPVAYMAPSRVSALGFDCRAQIIKFLCAKAQSGRTPRPYKYLSPSSTSRSSGLTAGIVGAGLTIDGFRTGVTEAVEEDGADAAGSPASGGGAAAGLAAGPAAGAAVAGLAAASGVPEVFPWSEVWSGGFAAATPLGSGALSVGASLAGVWPAPGVTGTGVMGAVAA